LVCSWSRRVFADAGRAALRPGRLTQGHPDQALFADIFPRYETFLNWTGFADIRLIRACGIGPSSVDPVPEAALRQAE
jgi:hypothetical protein